MLVTGANGFIGRGLCRELKDAGFEVTGTIRGQSSWDDDLFDPVATGYIGPDTDWKEALKEATLVVHLAGRAHVLNERALAAMPLYRRVNVEGTKCLAKAAAGGVRRFVFLSSISVYGESTSERPLTETGAPSPKNPYGISKRKAEQALAECAARTGLEVVILRPPLVYGPGAKGSAGSG